MHGGRHDGETYVLSAKNAVHRGDGGRGEPPLLRYGVNDSARMRMRKIRGTRGTFTQECEIARETRLRVISRKRHRDMARILLVVSHSRDESRRTYL